MGQLRSTKSWLAFTDESSAKSWKWLFPIPYQAAWHPAPNILLGSTTYIKPSNRYNKRVTTSFPSPQCRCLLLRPSMVEFEGSWDRGCLTQEGATVSSRTTTSLRVIPRTDPLASLLATSTQFHKPSHMRSLCSWENVGKKHHWCLQVLVCVTAMQ